MSGTIKATGSAVETRDMPTADIRDVVERATPSALTARTSGDDLQVYEPGSGEVRTVTRATFTSQQLGGPTGIGWDTPFVSVVPR
ncbi:MAG TPA: hypothetical protein PKC73_01660 [Dermatophilaceae bacterium]|nr:hypothetical protein [Actinomycetales bacterium]HMT32014.1 hypothetical protein [Dermatophilaceae bacterium]HMT88318.1 hypothetical protein [Dermatophilaceae bacterium]